MPAVNTIFIHILDSRRKVGPDSRSKSFSMFHVYRNATRRAIMKLISIIA